MTDAGTRSGVTWWAQLVLWATVLAVGALYLASVERHREDAAQRGTEVRAAPGARALHQVAVAEPVPMATKTAETPPDPSVPPPGPAKSGIQTGPAGPAPATVEVAQPAVSPASAPASGHGVSPTAASTTAPASAPANDATPPVPEGTPSLPAASVEVSPAEARAFAEAVTEGHLAGQEQAAPVLSPTAGQAPGPAGAPSLVDAERAHILAEYEALRRAVEADRGIWGRRVQRGPYGGQGVARPGAAPGGMPNQVPGGAPGYAPNYPRW
jgi:hypothetical protein